MQQIDVSDSLTRWSDAEPKQTGAQRKSVVKKTEQKPKPSSLHQA